MTRKHAYFVLLLALVACGGPGSGATSTEGPSVCEPEGPTGLEVGMCAPEFALPNAEGELVKLSSFRGKVALVDISAVW